MELQEGLEFYRRCLEYAKLSLQEVINNKEIPEWRKKTLIDKLLDRIIESTLKSRIVRPINILR